MAVENELKERQMAARNFLSPPVGLGELIWFYGRGSREPVTAVITGKEDGIPTPTSCQLVDVIILSGNMQPVREVRHKDHPLSQYYGPTFKSPGYWTRPDHVERADKKLDFIIETREQMRKEFREIQEQNDQFGWTEEMHIKLENRLRAVEERCFPGRYKRKGDDRTKVETMAQVKGETAEAPLEPTETKTEASTQAA